MSKNAKRLFDYLQENEPEPQIFGDFDDFKESIKDPEKAERLRQYLGDEDTFGDSTNFYNDINTVEPTFTEKVKKRFLGDGLQAQQTPVQPNYDDIKKKIYQQNPVLSRYDYQIEQVDRKSPHQGNIEFLSPTETGTDVEPGNTTGKPLIRLYQDAPTDSAELESAIWGDMLHHLSDEDKYWQSLRQDYMDARSDEVKEFDNKKYQDLVKSGQESRPFEQWMDVSWADAHVREALKENPEWTGIQTDKQLEILDKMRNYLSTGEEPAPIINHTVSSFLNRYAPPIDSSGQDNNFDNYLSVIKQTTGADPETPLADVSIDSLSQAIARQEGFFNSPERNQEINGRDTSLSQEWNNPGMLEYREQEGAMPSPEIKDSKGKVLYQKERFAVFQDKETGFQALNELLNRYQQTTFADPNESNIDISVKIARNNSLPDRHPLKRDSRELLLEDKKRIQSLKDQKILNAPDPVQAVKDVNAVFTQIDKSGMSSKGKEEAKNKFINSAIGGGGGSDPTGSIDPTESIDKKFDYSLEDLDTDVQIQGVETDLDKQLREFNKVQSRIKLGKSAIDLTTPLDQDDEWYKKDLKPLIEKRSRQSRGLDGELLTDVEGRMDKWKDDQYSVAIKQYNQMLGVGSKLVDDIKANEEQIENLYKLERKERPESVDPQVKEELVKKGAIIDGHYFYDTIKQRIIVDPELAQELNDPQTRFNEQFARPSHLLKINAETDDIADEDRLDVSDLGVETLISALPFAGQGYAIGEATHLAMLIHKLNKDEELTNDQLIYLRDFNDRIQRQVSWGHMTASGIAQLPAFIGELAFTGGAYRVGTKVTKEALEKGVKHFLSETGQEVLNKKLVDQGLMWGSKFLAVGYQTALARSGSITAGTVREMTDIYKITDKLDGDRRVFVPEKVAEGESLIPAFRKSALDSYIELLSERSGGRILLGAKWTKGKIVGEALEKAVKKANPKIPQSKISKILDEAGIQGFAVEWSEERLGQVLRHFAGVEDFEVPTWNQFTSELAVLAFPQGARWGANKWQQKKEARILEANAQHNWDKYTDISKIAYNTYNYDKSFDEHQLLIDELEQVSIDLENGIDVEKNTQRAYELMDQSIMEQTSLPSKVELRPVGNENNRTYILTIKDQYDNEVRWQQFGTEEEAKEAFKYAEGKVKEIQENHGEEISEKMDNYKNVTVPEINERTGLNYVPFANVTVTTSEEDAVPEPTIDWEDEATTGKYDKDAERDLQGRIKEIDELLKVAEGEDVAELEQMRSKVVEDLNRLTGQMPKVDIPDKEPKISWDEKKQKEQLEKLDQDEKDEYLENKNIVDDRLEKWKEYPIDNKGLAFSGLTDEQKVMLIQHPDVKKFKEEYDGYLAEALSKENDYEILGKEWFFPNRLEDAPYFPILTMPEVTDEERAIIDQKKNEQKEVEEEVTPVVKEDEKEVPDKWLDVEEVENTYENKLPNQIPANLFKDVYEDEIKENEVYYHLKDKDGKSFGILHETYDGTKGGAERIAQKMRGKAEEFYKDDPRYNKDKSSFFATASDEIGRQGEVRFSINPTGRTATSLLDKQGMRIDPSTDYVNIIQALGLFGEKEQETKETKESDELEDPKWTAKRVINILKTKSDGTQTQTSLLMEVDVPANVVKEAFNSLDLTLPENVRGSKWEYANAIENYYDKQRKEEKAEQTKEEEPTKAEKPKPKAKKKAKTLEQPIKERKPKKITEATFRTIHRQNSKDTYSSNTVIVDNGKMTSISNDGIAIETNTDLKNGLYALKGTKFYKTLHKDKSDAIKARISEKKLKYDHSIELDLDLLDIDNIASKDEL